MSIRSLILFASLRLERFITNHLKINMITRLVTNAPMMKIIVSEQPGIFTKLKIDSADRSDHEW
ncbi:MAG: hypothetical protein ABIE68_03395 [bacterium]